MACLATRGAFRSRHAFLDWSIRELQPTPAGLKLPSMHLQSRSDGVDTAAILRGPELVSPGLSSGSLNGYTISYNHYALVFHHSPTPVAAHGSARPSMNTVIRSSARTVPHPVQSCSSRSRMGSTRVIPLARNYRTTANRVAVVTDHPGDRVEVPPLSRGSVDLGGLTVERSPPAPGMGRGGR
jgi:hypothetical protein